MLGSLGVICVRKHDSHRFVVMESLFLPSQNLHVFQSVSKFKWTTKQTKLDKKKIREKVLKTKMEILSLIRLPLRYYKEHPVDLRNNWKLSAGSAHLVGCSSKSQAKTIPSKNHRNSGTSGLERTTGSSSSPRIAEQPQTVVGKLFLSRAG